MRISLVLLGTLLLAGAGLAFDGQDQKAKNPAQNDHAAAIAKQLPSYPLAICPVSDEELGGEMGEPIDLIHDGQLVRLCCKGCKKQFKKAPDAVVAKVKAAVVAAEKAKYPLKTCPVSGEELGGMGEPVNLVHASRLVRVCCKGCVKKVAADPGKALAKVDAAYIKAQLPTYPLTTCPVSDEELGGMGEPLNVLYGTQLVRLCCKGCKKGLKKNPEAILAKIHAAAKAK
jgi:hypothetical protein